MNAGPRPPVRRDDENASTFFEGSWLCLRLRRCFRWPGEGRSPLRAFRAVRRGFLGPSLFILGALLVSGSEATSQSIHGRVLVLGDTVGVSAADLTLADSTGVLLARVQTNTVGEFRLPAPGAGRFQVSASRIGFSAVSAGVLVREMEVVEVELRMAESAIPLEPIVVVGRREIKQGTLDEFYDRMSRMKQRGAGHFLTLEQIENKTQLSLPLLLQTIPGVWYWGRGSVNMLNTGGTRGIFCTPEFFLDGRPMLMGFREIAVLDLEGVEVYRGFSESVHGYFPDRCGQIFLWRKSDWGNPFRWGTAFLGLGMLAFGVAIASLF